jgi:RNA polymerase sigma-70 factor (ECF subfamily)
VKTDAELLKQTIKGSRQAFAELYSRYKSELFGYARAILRDEALAEDVLHDAFLRLFKSGHTIRNPEVLRQWLYVVVRRLSYDSLRWNRHAEPLNDQEPGHEPTPLEAVERKTSDEMLQDAIEHLPAVHREVVFLREVMQLSYEEIREMTGTTLPAVKSKLFKARKALAAVLMPYFQE